MFLALNLTLKFAEKYIHLIDLKNSLSDKSLMFSSHSVFANNVAQLLNPRL